MAAGAVAVAVALEAVTVEPPASLHPVAWFGRVVARLERSWAAPRVVGLAAAVVLPAGAAGAVALSVALATRLWPPAGVAVAGVALFASTSLRLLLSETRAVAEASEQSLASARERLRSLAGRDAATLSPGQIRSAAVESAGENLADGLVGPLAAFALVAPVSLSLAAGAAAWVKAVNTMDSMLGYRGEPLGWASARLDDVVMWIPARASAVLLAVAGRSVAALARARSWLGPVPSPNSGWPMGVLAAALAVRLEKPGAYVLNPDAPLPTSSDVERAVRTVAVAGVLAYVLAGAAILAWEVGVS
jgi:adenosylcobinamide-phosphate synthase